MNITNSYGCCDVSHISEIIIIGTAQFPLTAAFQKITIKNYNYWNCMIKNSDQTICEFINFRTTCKWFKSLKSEPGNNLASDWHNEAPCWRTKSDFRLFLTSGWRLALATW